jgi:hypothetical protein
MKLPTLRQVSGLAMLINTFLPAIVVIALVAMTWSTASAIKRTGCATVSYARQAMNDDGARERYVAATRDADKDKVLDELVERLYQRASLGDAACDEWKELRAQLQNIFRHELYAKTVQRVEYEIRLVDGKLQRVRTDVRKVVPRLPPITAPEILGVKEVVLAVNHLFFLTQKALASLGAALTRLGNGLAEPFDTAGENIYAEMQKVDYKRAVALELLGRWSDDAAGLLEKFGWFFLVLALWLLFSYALWVRRRLSAAWALLTQP